MDLAIAQRTRLLGCDWRRSLFPATGGLLALRWPLRVAPALSQVVCQNRRAPSRRHLPAPALPRPPAKHVACRCNEATGCAAVCGDITWCGSWSRMRGSPAAADETVSGSVAWRLLRWSGYWVLRRGHHALLLLGRKFAERSAMSANCFGDILLKSTAPGSDALAGAVGAAPPSPVFIGNPG